MELKQKNFKHCDICKVEEATSLCIQCFNYYCDSCYKLVHEKSENKQHRKEKIDYLVPIDTWCPEHEKNAMNLFCLDEKGNLIKLNKYLIYRIMLCLLPLY